MATGHEIINKTDTAQVAVTAFGEIHSDGMQMGK